MEEKKSDKKPERKRLLLGRISGFYGVRGWLKVYSFTDPRENIVTYRRWLVNLNGQWQEMTVTGGKAHGKGVVAKLEGLDDRDAVAHLLGSDIAVYRDELPALAAGEYYWIDLEGLKVQTIDGVELGHVHHMMETGANDVMVVSGERERLIPFTQAPSPGHAVTQIDTENGVIVVDWDPEF